MSIKLRVHGTEINFPLMCVVCGKTATEPYKVEQIFSYGSRAVTIQQNVPMCAAHFEQASSKSAAEKFVEWLGVNAGILLGLASAAALLIYWYNTEQGSLLLNILLALILGAGFGLIAWTLISGFAAPRFAPKDVRVVRNSVRLMRYIPAQNELEIAFEKAVIAQGVANANLDAVISSTGLSLYHIKGNLLCHDIRLNTDIETRAWLLQSPTEKEAERFLWPVAEAELNKRNCEDCPYNLRYLNIIKVSDNP